jgi:hypothetical protein
MSQAHKNQLFKGFRSIHTRKRKNPNFTLQLILTGSPISIPQIESSTCLQQSPKLHDARDAGSLSQKSKHGTTLRCAQDQSISKVLATETYTLGGLIRPSEDYSLIDMTERRCNANALASPEYLV